MTPFQILELAEGLVTLVGNLTAQIIKIKALAAKAGATDEQLSALDVRLSAAIAARQSEETKTQ